MGLVVGEAAFEPLLEAAAAAQLARAPLACGSREAVFGNRTLKIYHPTLHIEMNVYIYICGGDMCTCIHIYLYIYIHAHVQNMYICICTYSTFMYLLISILLLVL